MKKISVILMVLLTMLFVACGEKKEEVSKVELKKVDFLLDWVPNTNHTGLYVAKDISQKKV